MCRHICLMAAILLCPAITSGAKVKMTGRICDLDGKPLQQDIQGFRLLALPENVNQYIAVGRLIDSRQAPDKGWFEYEIEIDDVQLRYTSRQMKGREDVRVRSEFTASNRDRAIISGIASTAAASMDVVLPPKTERPLTRSYPAYQSYPTYQQGGRKMQTSNDRSLP